jgi:hypothetical protein
VSVAQEGGVTATLRGTVHDSSGAALPRAQVTLANPGTNALQSLVADDDGAFVISGLWPGTYELTIRLSGFKTSEQHGIVLSPNDTRGIDVTLEIGPQQETVVVTAGRDVVQTETGAREGVITAGQIESLSVISRGALELLRILPGVVAQDQTLMEVSGIQDGPNNPLGYTVNGIRSTRNTVSLDGSDLVDQTCNCGLMVSLNDDMVQEVKVQSSNFAAEYGSGGVNVSAVTKSGTARFHGAGYWYGRDHRWSANDRSNSITGVEKTKSNYFYPGGNVGGPLPLPGTAYNRKRDKLFFWFGLEAQRQIYDAGSHLANTISQAARTGDLSEFLANRGQNLNHPATVNIPGGFPGEGSPAPDNNLTPYVTPLGRAMANLYPLPNYSDPENRYNYVLSVPYPINRVESAARVDWNISEATKAYVRLALTNENVDFPRGVWAGPSDLELATDVLGRNRGRSLATNVVQVLSPTTTNEVTATYSRLTYDNPFRDPSRLRKDALGVDFHGFFDDQSPYIPVDHFYGWGGGQLGNYLTFGNDLYTRFAGLQLGDKLTKVAGTHALKGGVSLARFDTQQNYPNDESALMIYDPGSTPGSTGSQIGDLLVGRPLQIFQGTRVKLGVFRMWNLDVFAQDSWKVRPRVTLEYGARVGYWTNNAELNGLGAWFDATTYDPVRGAFIDPPQNQQLNGVRYAARGQAPLGVLPNRKPFVLPRLNAVWDISGDGTLVLRGGYGVFAGRLVGYLESNIAQFMPPNAFHAVGDAYYDTNLGGTGLTYDTAHLIPLDALLASQTLTTQTPASFTFLKNRSYSVSLARRIFWDQTIDAAYVGTAGHRLGSAVDLNAVPLGALSSGVVGNADLSIPVNRVNLDASVVNSKRPFPAYGFIQQNEFEGTSRYHSLQVTLSRQTGRRLQYFVAYTLSRTTGTFPGYRDPFDPSRTYGVLNEDRRHILNVSWNAMLPDGARGRLDSAIGRGLLNGWQLSGISALVSGVPIHLAFSGDAAGPGVSQAYFGTPDVVGPDQSGFIGGAGNSLAPEFMCDPRLGGSAVGEKLLNIDCIEVPAFGTSPPLVPPYDIRSPWHMNHDLTLFKNFRLHGGQKLQFRAGFFNIFNMARATTEFGSDIDLALETTCNRRVDHVPNGIGDYADEVCDPTGGYSFTENTRENFGKINLKHGHRVVELVVKYYF